MAWFSDSGYWLGRLVFQRLLAVLYVVAFLAAVRQFRALIGARGMLPVPDYVARVPFRAAPSVFHWHYSDRFFALWSWGGVLLAAAVAAGAADAVPLWASMVMWAVLWVLYLSIVNVGQTWYGFGWESLLLEAGSLAVFLGNAETAPPVTIMWLLRWLLFRVEFGAGLIKMRGDRCWRDLTCLYYHHETQPMPGPLSWFFHHLPRPLHRVEVAANHVAQLAVPVLLFTPQPIAGWAAVAMVVTQLWLVVSGNFAWLNWVTIALALSAAAPLWAQPSAPLPAPPVWFEVLVLLATAGVLALSYRPARNLLARQQMMNTSYESLHLVNSYGAFGSITRVRREIVVEGTADAVTGPDTTWLAYEFHGKPGAVRRMPRQFAPYHLRLDWLMWFAALSPAYARAWFVPFVTRLLENDQDTLRLLRGNPFPDLPPARIRARVFRYRFTTWRELRDTGAWWHRTEEREFLPPVARSALHGRR
ncbi:MULTISPECIES: lipase maturation factor family protein [unclassified Streptomyces]|uniref:lipase maturation factor family protein n=1 Tax=unclassified Streptomyces TaxID=2593676 RepID=UPI000823DEAC|nr:MULTISPECIES: lipase maturation factor family protein [unclassified Streptomyces]AWN30971.1 lipase maturation factor family protein [Streptomyces sp. NEAU-S7GS2]MYT13055.1 lipase maturation factor family protein [Streptomyces sp. SID4951]SCK44625.1 Lipase maturation factor [Streptomyces sp. SceaMP-e96]